MRYTALLVLWLAAAEEPPAPKKKAKAKKKSAKDWSKISLDEVERAWDEGEDPEDLKTEHQFYEETINKRRERDGAGEFPDFSKLNGMDPKEAERSIAHKQSETGAAMIFVTLAEAQPSGEAWDEAAERGPASCARPAGAFLRAAASARAEGRPPRRQKQASVFTALLRSGNIGVQAYRIGERRILLSTMKGWYGQDVVDFLTSQPAVMKVTWDSQDYENPDVPQNDLPDHAPGPKAKRRKKRKKKKAAAADL